MLFQVNISFNKGQEYPWISIFIEEGFHNNELGVDEETTEWGIFTGSENECKKFILNWIINQTKF